MSAQDRIALSILEPALEYVVRCPVDSKIIQDQSLTLGCPSCGAKFCMFPCAEKLALKNKKCPNCGRFEMGALAEIVQNSRHLIKLEELKDAGRVSALVYEKLKLDYENKYREAIVRVYPVRQDEIRKEGTIRCPSCGKKANYIAEYNRWYCYGCEAYLP